MIPRFLARFLTKPNPGRDLAMIRVNREREKIRAKAREMRAAMGLPPLPILERR